MNELDVLAVGDIVTDNFIRLFEDKAHAYENGQGKWLALPFGTKLPFDHSEVVEGVGNAANAAVSLARLGHNSGLIANVGGDVYGREMISSLQKNRVDTRFVQVNPGKKSNYHYVLWYREERTILINHEQYDYHWPHFRPNEKPRWLYCSSIAKNALEFHDTIADWLDENQDVKFAFQPGTYQLEFGPERLSRIYRHTEVIFVNREEATLITHGNHEDVHDLFNKLHELGPKAVVITDGPAGAYASGAEGRFRMPNYPDPKPPYERTGAGDAFASTFVAALMKGANLEGALQWAPINSMNVVQHVGAQEGLLTEQQLTELLQHAPDWYKPERI